MRVLAVLCGIAATAWGAEPRQNRISTPSEIIARIEKSPTEFAIRDIAQLELGRGRLVEEQWKPVTKYLDLPKVVRKGGTITLQRWPEPEATSRTAKAMAAAETAFQAKDYAEAAKHYRAATQLSPKYYLAYAYLADALLFGETADNNGALALYDRAIAINPDDYRLYFFRSTVQRRLGKKNEARADLRHALLLRPHYDRPLEIARKASSASGLRAEPERFVPRAFVRRADDGKTVELFVEAERSEWLAWAMCKALWLDDAGYRKLRTGSGDSTWHSLEDYECLAQLVSVYVANLEKKKTERDDRLDRIARISEEGLLNAFVIYEFGARVDPMLVLQLPDEERAKVARYIERFVLTDALE